MNYSTKISVIIPIYNAEDYIAECIESILHQSLRELELIIIDDGSDDCSWEIIQSYKNRHNNIRAYQQTRQRQGAARNLGLKHAVGEFVTFVDADDLVPNYAYQEMYQLAQKNHAEMVVGILESFNERRKWHGVHLQEERFTKTHPLTDIFKLPELLRDTSACNKLFKKTVLDKHQIKFGTKTAGDDLFFTAKAYIHTRKISVYPRVSYNYRATSGGSSSRINPHFFRDRVSITLELKQYYSEQGAKDILPILMHVELRKLVTNRPQRVIKNNIYNEQIETFQYVQRLTDIFSINDILNSEDLTEDTKVRVLFIMSNSFDSLIAYENNPWTMRFLPLLKENKYKNIIVELITKVKEERICNTPQVSLKRKIYIKSRNCKIFFSRLYHQGGLRLKVTASYFLIKLFTTKSERNCWLIDERVGQSAEDNSFYLFQYIRQNHPDLNIFYVINKNSPQKKNVTTLGNVVNLHSLEHMKLLIQATVLFSTDSYRTLALPFEVLPWLRHKTYNVFLQHGVSGNKTTTYFKKNYPFFSSVIVCSENEKRMFVDTYGFQEHEVNITGFSRFDQLSTKSPNSPANKILIASTWRKWLKRDDRLYPSKYFYYWSELLKSKRLAELLEKHDAHIFFQPHFNMMSFINEFEEMSNRIIIQNEAAHEKRPI